MTDRDWPRVPYVGVGCIVMRAGKVLLMRRQNAHGYGSWSTPGGHLDFGETPEACAARETLEETGMEVINVRFVTITNDVFTATDKHYVTLWMQGDAVAGSEARIVSADEVAELGWYALDALPSPLFLSFQHLLEVRQGMLE